MAAGQYTHPCSLSLTINQMPHVLPVTPLVTWPHPTWPCPSHWLSRPTLPAQVQSTFCQHFSGCEGHLAPELRQDGRHLNHPHGAGGPPEDNRSEPIAANGRRSVPMWTCCLMGFQTSLKPSILRGPQMENRLSCQPGPCLTQLRNLQLCLQGKYSTMHHGALCIRPMPSTPDGLLLGPGLTQHWLEVTSSTKPHSPCMDSIHPGSWPSADLALPTYEITARPQPAARSTAGK